MSFFAVIAFKLVVAHLLLSLLGLGVTSSGRPTPKKTKNSKITTKFAFGAIWCYLLIFGAIWCYLVLFGAIWCYLVLFAAIWCYLVLFAAICCYLLIFGAI